LGADYDQEVIAVTIDEAIADLIAQIQTVAPEAVIRVQRRSNEEAAIRAYAGADYAEAIRAATQGITLSLLNEGLDVQVLTYDIATSLPPE
jgi:hypothetical protein